MSNKLSKKDMTERKRSIENFKRINTMGYFEIEKNCLDNSMEKDKIEPKPKKKKSNNIPLSYAKPKETKTPDVQKMNSFKNKTLAKVRENSPGVEFINEDCI